MQRNTPTFRWKLSYMGGVEYEVHDETGSYLVEIAMRSPNSYHLSVCNGDDVRSEVKSRVGILRRCSCIRRADGSWTFEVGPEVVDAFNEWRMEQHFMWLAQLEAQPERYGVIGPDDEFRRLPLMARGGDYRFGEHVWEVTHALA
ncbi:hypothetical protein HAP48_0042885 [Bradyrhizobium septentrionale]|uniref:Uncharacterized protein n=1 Tax=Bradyrhizobium septentrionale TaxID=1404411 RepID=A0A974A3N1_9BRAD|nr:hypothetical protein [Bradyrhizobium septentrionale]UGY15204.1 hypothetical protein HAP48_0042885 [Bradyrhizobium septentrionale]